MPLLGNKKHKPPAAKIRVVETTVTVQSRPKPPAPTPLSRTGSSSSLRAPKGNALLRGAGGRARDSLSPYPTSSDEKKRKRGTSGGSGSRKPSPAVGVKFESDSDGGDEDQEDAFDRLARGKRSRTGNAEGRLVDEKRRVRDARAFEERDGSGFIHADRVASLELGCEPVLGATADDVAIELQYPSLAPRERYVLRFFVRLR